MLNSLQARILDRFTPAKNQMDGSAYAGSSKLRKLLGEDWIGSLNQKVVADFGCGAGAECVELSKFARRVIGIDIEPRARELARSATLHLSNVTITEQLAEPVDVIISLDSFEHYGNPAEILRIMTEALAPGGAVLTSFGPTWYHPLGGHLFSVFPWAHLVFSEQALCQWRSKFRSDGARRFDEVEGGLNRMTIARFEDLVAQSGLRLVELLPVPIRALKWAHCRPTREFTSAIVRAKLIKP